MMVILFDSTAYVFTPQVSIVEKQLQSDESLSEALITTFDPDECCDPSVVHYVWRPAIG